MTLLEVKGLETFYGASQALFGVDLDIGEGEVVALMGRNGMGKTTTISSIIGLVRPRAGAINFGGTAIFGMRPHRPFIGGFRRVSSAYPLFEGSARAGTQPYGR